MNKINLYSPVLPPSPPIESKGTSLNRSENVPDFREVLKQKLPSEIKFSNHCMKRLEQNNIQVSSQQMDKLKSAVDKAESKGSRESCVIMEDMAFIVSVQNRTVITVVDGQRMKDNVFTNIDSAVIV